MGMFDDLATANPAAVQQTKPTKGRFIKEGYFDWDNPAHATPDVNNKAMKEAVGVILPPYATYLNERVAAAKAGQPFNVPFWLSVGLHAMGGRNDKDKVYIQCQRDLLRANKVGTGHPMISPSLLALPDTCPVCDAAWDIVWPKVKEWDNRKDTAEYKSYKEAHKQLVPQQKAVFNFLPMGSDQPVLLEAPKTLAESITNLHYDPKQPDLLWPYTIGNFACCWIQFRREERQDTTAYTAFPVYTGTPHVRNAGGGFDEVTYQRIIAKMKDLREISKNYIPSPEDLGKALIKRDKIVSFSGLAIAHGVAGQVAQATAGVQPSFASPPPTVPMPPMLAPTPVPGGAPIMVPTTTLPAQPPAISPAGPPPIGQPMSAPVAQAPAPVPAGPPAIGSLPTATTPMAAPVQPPQPVSADANSAFDVLQNLLGGPGKPG